MSMPGLPRRLLSEYLATALLLAAVIGSGIMAERLSGGNVALALLANTFATVGALYVLIEVFGPVSGAHMNPVVTLAFAYRRRLPWPSTLSYVAAQLAGAASGAWLAHAMFARPLLQWSTQARDGPALWLAEVVAAAGLVLVVLRAPASRVAAAVAAWIGAAYWFTASTAFANPAAAFGRMLSDSFTGIAPSSVPAFVAAQCLGAALALALHRALGALAAPAPAVAE